jgi:hypothetical protein
MRNLTEAEQHELDHAYTYHETTAEQIELYAEINAAAKNFEATVLRACPPSADRTFATRQIRDARMTANRSIALDRTPQPLTFSCAVSPALVDAGDPVTVTGTARNLCPLLMADYSWATTGGKISGESSTATIDTWGLAPGVYTVKGHVSQGVDQADCSATFTVGTTPFDCPQPGQWE